MPGICIDMDFTADENFVYVSATDAVFLSVLNIKDLNKITVF